jgi:hypothetical protein
MTCLHDGCTCRTDRDQEFCSDYCRTHAAVGEHASHACQCGHPGCGSDPASA